MQTQDFDEVVELIAARDPRYDHAAYEFIREALDFTQKAISKANKGKLRHISGQELLAGARAYALQQYGPMALALLNEWGIRRGEDIGELVFNLVESGLFSKTDADTRADFQGGFDFDEAFRKPFLPSRPWVVVRPPDTAKAGP